MGCDDAPADEHQQSGKAPSHALSSTRATRRLRWSPMPTMPSATSTSDVTNAPESADGAMGYGSAVHDGAAPERHSRRGPDAVETEAPMNAMKRNGREVPVPRSPPPTVTPPCEIDRSVNTEIRPRTPAPYPRCNHPAPSVGRVVHVLVRLAIPVGRHVRIGVTVGRPDPAVLLGVYPLALG